MDVEDATGAALTPHRDLGLRVVEQGRDRELLDGARIGVAEAAQDLGGVEHPGRVSVPSAVELHELDVVQLLRDEVAAERAHRGAPGDAHRLVGVDEAVENPCSRVYSAQ